MSEGRCWIEGPDGVTVDVGFIKGPIHILSLPDSQVHASYESGQVGSCEYTPPPPTIVDLSFLSGESSFTLTGGSLTPFGRALFGIPEWCPGRTSMRRRARRLLRRRFATREATQRAINLLLSDYVRGMTVACGIRRGRRRR